MNQKSFIGKNVRDLITKDTILHGNDIDPAIIRKKTKWDGKPYTEEDVKECLQWNEDFLYFDIEEYMVYKKGTSDITIVCNWDNTVCIFEGDHLKYLVHCYEPHAIDTHFDRNFIALVGHETLTHIFLDTGEITEIHTR